ncbi:oplophorus-luciferin 2-monooxygenase non-catalytic subunit-like [Portunus trituberculatus]|uniref:oplophorus-luciferin 2-monooxygenase non-catalytic subunit-like n=1 Tax=Portunus trituberculatus TaxID=210409 RepID=UPI001E1CD7D8|nr:oplophorus-luciferin 2-monooxygenase non-catalytic subunit-like [Portunus trituberculatus]
MEGRVTVLLLLLLCVSSNYGSQDSNFNQDSSLKQNSSFDLTHFNRQGVQPLGYPCPGGNDIKPCVCLSGGFMIRDLHCSGVANETQLAQVFSAKFPYRHFRSLVMVDNAGVKELRAGVFGDLTFQELRLVSGSLERIEAGTFAKSHNTLNLMHFYYNNIHDFPFAELASFTKLREVRLYGNKFSLLPPLTSLSMEIFSIGYNPLHVINDTTFAATPALRELHLYGVNLTELQPGIFSKLPNLSFLSLRDNHLSNLLDATVTLGGVDGGQVYLQNNDLTFVAPNALTGLGGGCVYLQDNALMEVAELAWRPLLEANVTLDLRTVTPRSPTTSQLTLDMLHSTSA